MNARDFIALYTLSRREVMRFIRIWTQTLLPSPISILLYFVIFGSLIGSRIGMLEGHRYVDYIAPGLIMMAIINNSYANVVASSYVAKFQRSIEEMFVSPMPPLIILLGFLIGGIARGLLVALIVTGVALWFTDLMVYNWFVTLTVGILTSVLFSLAGLINGIFANSFDDINIVPTFILTPLTYLGGVFYSIHILPPFWQKVSYFNPIFYMVNTFRYGMLGISDINVTLSLCFLIIFIIGLWGWAWWLLSRGIGVRS